MDRLIGLQIGAESSQVQTADQRLDHLAQTAGKAERATDALAGGTKRAGGAMAAMIASIEKNVAELVALTRAQNTAGVAAESLAKAQRDVAKAANDAGIGARNFGKQFDSHVDLFRKHAAGSKLAGHEIANLSRQFADIGVTGAMGMNPLMILIQQGPQIADTLALAAARGVNLSTEFKNMAAAGLALVGRFAGLLGALGLIGGAIWLVVSAFQGMNKASAETTKAIEANETATDAYVKAAKAAERASGDLRTMLDADADAARRNAEATRKATVEKLNLAKASLAAARALEGRASTGRIGSEIDPTGGFSSGVQLGAGVAAKTAQTQVDAYTKALREQDIAIKQLEQDMASGGRSMLDSLQRQNAEYGKTRGQIILMNAAAEAAKPANAAHKEALLAAAKAAAANADAEDRLAAAKRGGKTATQEATEAAVAYIARLREEREAVGANAADQQALEVRRAAMAAPTRALAEEIRASARALDEERRAADEAKAALERLDEATRARLMRNWTRQFDDVKGPQVSRSGLTADGAKEFSSALTKAANDNRERFVDMFADALSGGVMAAFEGNLGGFLESSFRTLFAKGLDQGLRNVMAGLESGKVSKIDAISVGAMVAGGAIGGKAGGTLAGAGAGAALGMKLSGGNPIIAALGAWAGGILGFIGASKAAKKALEEQRKAQEELNRAATKQGFDIWIEVLRGMGQATSAQTVTRQQEMAGIDPRNQEMMSRLYGLQDARDLEDMQLRLMEAQGDASGALALRRKQELDATTDALAPTLRAIYAAEDLAAAEAKLAAEREAAKAAADEALRINQDVYAQATSRVAEAQQRLNDVYAASVAEVEQARDKFKGLAETLRDVRMGLDAQIGGKGVTDALFASTVASALLGDPDAMARLAQMAPGQADAARSSARTELEALRGVALVRNAVKAAEDTAGRQVSIAERQLMELQRAGQGWVTLNNTTATGLAAVGAAIQNLSAAFGLKQAAVAGAKGFYGAPENEAINKALERATGYNGGFGSGGFQDYITGRGSAYQSEARRILESYGQTDRIVGFATGGFGTVGGSGGTDSQRMALDATPGEWIGVSRSDPMEGIGALLDEVRGLRAEVVELRKDTARGADASKRTSDVIEGSAYGDVTLRTGT